MKASKKVFAFFVTLIVLSANLLGCEPQNNIGRELLPVVRQESRDVLGVETENLAKLCKVWGYVKYRHPTFLFGKRDWDAELLDLIPLVRELDTAEAVNELLHEWFVSLGKIDYGTRAPVKLWAGAKEADKVIEADTAWTADIAYLGEKLAEDLKKISVSIPNLDRSRAPVSFGQYSTEFTNEKAFDMQYDHPDHRLLGVFRLWNAMEYYFPYLHLMDAEWGDCLVEHIPLILEGTDQVSYEMALASMAFRTKDAHVMLLDSVTGQNAMLKYFGEYELPVLLKEAEGALVVTGVTEGCPLEVGDVLVSINGEKIGILTETAKQYVCYPREEMLLMHARYLIARSATADIAVTVLRDSRVMDLTVRSAHITSKHSGSPYEILNGGIGLINPSQIEEEETVHQAMTALRETIALIIDMRQYPGGNGFAHLYGYIPEKNVPAIAFAAPSAAVPGAYVKATMKYGYNITRKLMSLSCYAYDKPVVVLMDETSMSFSETAITVFGTGENVVLMGTCSVGANGDTAVLPLPGDLNLLFSSRGVYDVDGTQTQRIGIAPDIRVEPTIQGIKEGRDEVLEAAVKYIQNTQ